VAVHLALTWGILACLLAGGCASTDKQRSAGGGGERLKLACRLANYAPYEDAGWAHMQSIGIRHVFINVPDPDQVAAVQKKLRDHQLTPVVMRGTADLSKDSSIDELAAQTAICRRMGVDYMFLSVKHHGAPKADVYARLRRAGDAARENRVIITLETHPEFGTNGDVHVETMQQIDHPNIRVNFDTGNITYYNRDTDAVAELKKTVPYVATVEIKDHSGEFETWNFPAFGKGTVDIGRVLRVLSESGYRGPVTMEIEGVKGVERSEAQIRRDIEESTAFMRSIGQFE
jgi:sugar phosphate isomerase/epimerase